MAELKFKIILMGDANSGKTSLITRYIKGEFISASFPTIGETLYTKKLLINNQNVLLKIYDTAGVEDYGGIQQITIRDSNVVIFLSSYDSKESLESINNIWWNVVTNVLSETSFLGFIGINKLDINENDKEFNKNDIINISNVHNLSFNELSAKTGENVEIFFENIVKELLKNINIIEKKNNLIDLNNTINNEIPKKKNCC